MTHMMKNRPGMTLLESLVALTMLGTLITLTLAAVDRQVRLFSNSSTQMDAMQNLRFAMSELEKDLPTVGTNVSADQPFLVYTGADVVTFNADYLSNVLNDPFAIYVDTAALDVYATAVTRERRFVIPGTLVGYPDTSYLIGGQNSPAETITFHFASDTSTARTDDYILIRKVNEQAPDIIARNLYQTPGLPFFQYLRRVTPVSGVPFFELVPAGQLPLRHVRATHLAVDDTGNVARIDSLRAIRVNFRSSDGRGAHEKFYAATRTIAFPNAGLSTKKTCGDEPLLGNINFTATAVTVNGVPGVQLAWARATDEAGGERDVIRYTIYRREGGGPLPDPFLSIPAGNAVYTYVDTEVRVGQVYLYSIAAQDCTPSLSEITNAAPVVP